MPTAASLRFISFRAYNSTTTRCGALHLRPSGNGHAPLKEGKKVKVLYFTEESAFYEDDPTPVEAWVRLLKVPSPALDRVQNQRGCRCELLSFV